MGLMRSIITKDERAARTQLFTSANDAYDKLAAGHITEHEALAAIGSALFTFISVQPVQEEATP